MGIFSTLTNFFNKYGGRTSSKVQQNYDNRDTYGSPYISKNYTDPRAIANAAKIWKPTSSKPYEGILNNKVSGTTATQFSGVGIVQGNHKEGEVDFWRLPSKQVSRDSYDPQRKTLVRTQHTVPGNQVYFANYDGGMGEHGVGPGNEGNIYDGPDKKLEKHAVFQGWKDNSVHHVYHTYPTDEGAKRRADKAKEDEWEMVKKADKGYAFTGFHIEDILNTHGITMDRLRNKILNLNSININRSPTYTEIINFGKQYVFFTKPDLNLFSDNAGTINPSIKENCPDLYMKILRNVGVARSLQCSFAGINKTSGGLINLLTNYCNSIDWPSFALSLKEGPKNAKGQGISYGGDFNDASKESELEISFIDNRDRDVETMIEIWTEYIEGVNNGVINPKSLYIAHNTIDYAINIFVFTLDENYNLVQFGMAHGCFPTSVNTDLLTYTALTRDAPEYVGPFNYSFHVSAFYKPNSHRILELFNYSTGFDKHIQIPLSEGSHKYMYTRINGYYIHSGYIPYGTTLRKGYEFHFNLEDKWAELVGITFNIPSSGTLSYTLVFASRNVGEPKGAGDFGERQFPFYKFDDDIEQNWENYNRWASEHPGYFNNKPNPEAHITGPWLWNHNEFDPDYDAWQRSQGGRTWEDRYMGGWSSANNRFGAFRAGSSSSQFFSGATSQFMRIFSRKK